LDWCAAAGQRVWQLLPLGPPAGLGSPYGCLSAFAGNPLLISPELLMEDGLLEAGDLDGYPELPADRVDYPAAEAAKEPLLRRAWDRFQGQARPGLRQEVEAFLADPAHRFWWDDWTLFCALRGRFGGHPWQQWDPPLAHRRPEALKSARRALGAEIAYHGFLQFLFFRQWRRARDEAHRRGFAILGDLPIYVTTDSAEVWAAPHLFDLDDEGRPRHVAGVPPDYFSATGQRWGNPLYRWDRMEENGFGWWIERMRSSLRLFDRVRMDHFRGFEAYWEVPAEEPDARAGRWVPGPGRALFDALREALGPLPLIAEDLGMITEEVRRLRNDLGLPGMRVLQFAFAEPDSEHRPCHYEPHSVVYTGTHDNDTARGWYEAAGEEERHRAREYLGTDGSAIEWDLIRAAYTSVARLAVVPLQDVLGLGSEARFNTPAQTEGNWVWRVRGEQIHPDLAGALRRLVEVTGRGGAG
jgi:4-alpha-glucanotransferase